MPKPSDTRSETQVTPARSLEKRSRRTFSTEYKLRIIAQADRCRHGELGALPRREKLYSNQLAQWRGEMAEGGVKRLSKTTPGPMAKLSAQDLALAQLQRDNTRLARELEIANGCLDLQKSLGDARSREHWEQSMTLVTTQCPEQIPLARACAALALTRSSVYARLRPRDTTAIPPRSRRQAFQPRALTHGERRQVLGGLHSDAYCDQPPVQVYQQLLEQDRYLCSVSTMHRVLRQAGEHGERRHQRPAHHHGVPRPRAQAPNEVWSWDITKHSTSTRGAYLSLYV